MSGNPFDYINAISQSKVDLIRTAEDQKEAERKYNSYLVNKGLSYFIDTVLYANEMNMYHEIDSKLKNDYLINTIRSKKRFAKWVKPVSVDDLGLVQSYYNYSYEKARQALSILSEDQLSVLRGKKEQGGIK